MSFANNVGRFIGHIAADAVEGTKLVHTQLAIGAREGYTQRAATLRAARLAALSEVGISIEPPKPAKAQRQSKLNVATA